MNDRGWLARPREEERGRRTEGCLTFLLHLWTEWDLVEKCLQSWFKPNLEALFGGGHCCAQPSGCARHAARSIFALWMCSAAWVGKASCPAFGGSNHPWGLACACGEQAVSFLEKAAACAALLTRPATHSWRRMDFQIRDL